MAAFNVRFALIARTIAVRAAYTERSCEFAPTAPRNIRLHHAVGSVVMSTCTQRHFLRSRTALSLFRHPFHSSEVRHELFPPPDARTLRHRACCTLRRCGCAHRSGRRSRGAGAASRYTRPAQLRTIADLPLRPDGSAVEYTPADVGTIVGRPFWKTNGTPDIEFDYRKMKVKIDARGTARLAGTLTSSDLEKLPRKSAIYLLQCGAPQPRGIVKWTGVRFSDFAQMVGAQSFANYVRVIGSDLYYLQDDMKTLMHPQVMLAWEMNDKADPAGIRGAATTCRAVPLRRAQHERDYGHPVHGDVLPPRAPLADLIANRNRWTPRSSFPSCGRRRCKPWLYRRDRDTHAMFSPP